MFESLRGKQIVLAGGAGGLGSAAARLLAAEGAELAIGYRANAARARELAPLGRIVRADLTNAADRIALLNAAPELYGLVVFTGDPSRVSAPEALEDAMRRSHDANYLGPVLLAREAAHRMTTAGMSGAIVLFSTMQALSVFPGSTAYAAQKAALIQAARVLAKECRGAANIRVNVIAPGVIAAGMAETSIAAGKYAPYVAAGAIHRYGRAQDIARTVRFLLEPDNYITGQVLTVDGGLTL